MESKRLFLEEFAVEFDLNRIKHLALPEKFKLVNHIRLIYSEARALEQKRIKDLASSPNYTVNRTYNLFAMLLMHDVPGQYIHEIVRNYAHNFEKSDTYYAQITILGMGVMMIQKGYAPEAILSYLMHLLGDEFLVENLKYSGRMTDDEASHFEFDRQIVFKPFEGNLRRVKYNLLGLLKLRDTQGMEAVRRVVNGRHSDNRFRLYFNQMDLADEHVREVIFEDLKDEGPTENRLKIYGAYALHAGLDVFTTHYLFNSIIGKYSRFDKDSSEIEAELSQQLEEILEKAEIK